MAGPAQGGIDRRSADAKMAAMCTLVLLLRPASAWPLLIAANRDEMLRRAADPPGAWWAGQPDVVGGRDREAGGTWLALRRDGMVAAVLNRSDSLGPAPGLPSRGALPLLALGCADPAAAAALIVARPERYRPFNLVVADRASAWFVRGGPLGAEARPLRPGLHMVTSRDPDDASSPRTARHLPRLEAAAPPRPPDWIEWNTILADRSGTPENQINITPIGGFGTVSSCRIGVPGSGAPVFDYADGPPHAASFKRVLLPQGGRHARAQDRLGA